MIVKEKIGGLFFDLIKGDCLEEMKNIPDKSIDAIICDLPYGTTACKWDIIIPFESLWKQYKRVIKDNGAIVLFASQPFTTLLINSNFSDFRYEWIWHKNQPTGFGLCYKMPMKIHENVCVFYKKLPTYNYIKEERDANKESKNRYKYKMSLGTGKGNSHKYIANRQRPIISDVGKRFPTTVQYFKNVPRAKSNHPSEKPLELIEYLVKTYSNENDTILDNTMGSGTTGLACKNTNRNFIGIEKDNKYFDIAVNRIKGTEPNTNNFEKVEVRGLFSFTDEPTKAD